MNLPCSCLIVWLILSTLQLPGAESKSSKSNLREGQDISESHRQIVREGTALKSREGKFKATGDGATFEYTDESNEGENTTIKCIALANLMLERVAQTLREMPDANDWLVSGDIYEFRGENYILLRRAVLKSNTTIQAAPVKRAPTRRPDDRSTPGRGTDAKSKSK